MSDYARSMQERINSLTGAELKLITVIDSNKAILANMEYGSDYLKAQSRITQQESELEGIRRELNNIEISIKSHELSLVPQQPLPAVDNSVELAKIAAEEAEKQRDHELQLKLYDLEIAKANAEAARLAAEASAKAQEQASGSLDALIAGMKNDGQPEN